MLLRITAILRKEKKIQEIIIQEQFQAINNFVISIDLQKGKKRKKQREKEKIKIQKERVKAIVDRSNYCIVHCGRKFSSFGLFLQSRFTKFIVQRTIRLLPLLLSRVHRYRSPWTIHFSNEINFSRNWIVSWQRFRPFSFFLISFLFCFVCFFFFFYQNIGGNRGKFENSWINGLCLMDSKTLLFFCIFVRFRVRSFI